jgi:protein SCO1/2
MILRRYLLLGLASLVGLGAVYATLVFARPHEFQGSVIDPPAPARDFTLIDQAGKPFTLSQARGSLVLLFFGYTNCPDVCPVTLTDFKKIKEQLGAQAERVKFVFVTTDPERDTPERIATYLENFDPAITGLTGDLATLEKVWQDYGVYRVKVEGHDHSDYTVDHSSRLYAIGPDGKLHLTFTFGTSPEAMTGDVQALLREG